MSEMNPARTVVEILAADEQPAWPEALVSSAGFVGLKSWMEFVRETYHFPAYFLAARTGADISGVLALCHVSHPIFGNFLATAPFASYGGFAFSTAQARDLLLEEARNLARTLGVEYTNVRFDGGEQVPPAGWVQQPIYATYLIDLRRDPDSFLGSYGADHRNHIRKALKKGYSIRFGGAELLNDAYDVLARSMHELGSPYHSKAYLCAMANALGSNLELVVLRGLHGELAGAGAFIIHGDVVTNLHANILKRFRSDYAGEFLYWSGIRHYGEAGFRVLDLGRSLIGSGNETFKTKWKPRKQVLAYWYALEKGTTLPALNQHNAKFRAAIWIWKRLPSFVVRPVGPFLIKGLA
jgi:FemAB-related protein (PEP-CTERM system-associated)